MKPLSLATAGANAPVGNWPMDYLMGRRLSGHLAPWRPYDRRA
jgi:hypothetical protein